MTTLSRYFISSLLARLYCLPWYPVLWCKWLAEEFPRSARSSSSSDDGPLHLPSLDSHPHVQPRLVCKRAFFHPRTRPMCFVLRSDSTLPTSSFPKKIYFISKIHYLKILIQVYFKC